MDCHMWQVISAWLHRSQLVQACCTSLTNVNSEICLLLGGGGSDRGWWQQIGLLFQRKKIVWYCHSWGHCSVIKVKTLLFPYVFFLGSPARLFSPSPCDQSHPRTSGTYLLPLLRTPPDHTSTESFLLRGPPSMNEFFHGHRLSKEKRLTVAIPGKHFFLGCM